MSYAGTQGRRGASPTSPDLARVDDGGYADDPCSEALPMISRLARFFTEPVLLALAPIATAAQDIVLPDPIPLGTTVGQRANRLLIRNAMLVSGRGTPRSNRAMPPEGPIDILIENGRIIDMVLRDPVNMAGGLRRGPRRDGPSADAVGEPGPTGTPPWWSTRTTVICRGC